MMMMIVSTGRVERGKLQPSPVTEIFEMFRANADDWDKSTQEMCFGKAMCIVKIHEIEITSINNWNNDSIKANQDDLDFCFCAGSVKSRFEWFYKKPF